MERKECTEKNPYPNDGQGRWFHPQAKHVESEDVYTDWYKCPICGHLFGETVPD